jgi:hypothetical protein
MKSIKDLTDIELYCIRDHGYIASKMKDIAELHFFYNRIEDEIKRRELKNNQ